MLNPLWPARFFLVVSIVPPAIVIAFAVMAVAGSIAIITGLANLANPANPEQGIRIVEPILLLQLFATASGFRVPASRGHYDLLFTSGENRLVIGVMHWLVSALPGVLSWLVVATTGHLYGREDVMTPDLLLMLLVTSTVPWALTIPLPRMAGAIVCMVAMSFGVTVDLLPSAAVIGTTVASVAGGLIWIRRMDVPLESGQ